MATQTYLSSNSVSQRPNADQQTAYANLWNSEGGGITASYQKPMRANRLKQDIPYKEIGATQLSATIPLPH